MIKILIAAIHYPVCSARYMADAFKRIGCDVRTIGNSTGGRIWGMQIADKYAWQSDGDLTAHWDDWTPDLVLIMDSAWAYHHPFYAGVSHAVYGVDNHCRDYRQPGVARYFLAHNAVSIMPMDATDTEWLPCGYDPVWFTPSPIPFEQRKYDVALIGVPYQRRVEIVEAMRKAGLNVFAGVGLVYDQYRDVYHNSRIALSVSVAGDVAMRVFEGAALGCYVLSDECPDFEPLFGHDNPIQFEDVEDAIYKAEALSKLIDFKRHDVKDHTWDARAARIVEWWQETYAPPKQETKKRGKAND